MTSTSTLASSPLRVTVHRAVIQCGASPSRGSVIAATFFMLCAKICVSKLAAAVDQGAPDHGWPVFKYQPKAPTHERPKVGGYST